MTNCSTAATQAEIRAVPELTDSTIDIGAGLLLPIWTRPANESTRVDRVQTDDRECIIRRKLSPASVTSALTTGAPVLTADAAFAALMERRTIFGLAETFQLRRVRAIGADRIGLSKFNDTLHDQLKAHGRVKEIISWKLRMFLPAGVAGVAVLARVLDTYPIGRIGEREAV